MDVPYAPAFEGDLTGARFERADLSQARFRSCLMGGITMRDVEISDMTIDGEVRNLVINGVEVAALVEAELDRREPDRVRFRPTTPDGFREAWDLNEVLWSATVARASRLPAERLHESVEEEWSFIQTLRHLAFATESWIGRCILGDPRPWHPLSLPWDEMRPRDGVPQDRDARPTLSEALELRLCAMALMRQVVDGLTERQLAGRTEPLAGPGWPDEGATFDVRECLLIVLNESGATACTPNAIWLRSKGTRRPDPPRRRRRRNRCRSVALPRPADRRGGSR